MISRGQHYSSFLLQVYLNLFWVPRSNLLSKQVLHFKQRKHLHTSEIHSEVDSFIIWKPRGGKKMALEYFWSKQASQYQQTTSLIAEALLYSFWVPTHQSRRAGVHMILQGPLHVMIALRCGFWGIMNNEQPCAHSHNFYTTIIILCSFPAIRNGALVAFILSATLPLSHKIKIPTISSFFWL